VERLGRSEFAGMGRLISRLRLAEKYFSDALENARGILRALFEQEGGNL